MNYYIKYLFKVLLILGLFSLVFSCSTESTEDSSGLVKVALRNVGHHLLLINHDSVSIVKPIKELDELKFQLSFEQQLIINPDSLITLVKNSFQKANLPQHYLVEVIQCKDYEVAYSYQMNQNTEKGIIPCKGRPLKKACYFINVRFTKSIETNKSTSYSWVLYILLLSVIGIITLLYFKRKTKIVSSDKYSENYTSIGKYKFYPEQNKLTKETVEISLSKKECELLTIFIAQPNQIIKRDELTKKVWEDNGVFVGRSLDTYISKLRNKLKADESVKLINVHGVGYKLEIGN
jgi:DNA-binding winged helix-turn-helix (wHTH) protein